ncbi:MAG: hypothetical protein D6703_00360 [Zetaproteobacteria bacterium]|nr:MAG: hypothetical protein D6703_00360 [Zetaproteobacteria bacterium]
MNQPRPEINQVRVAGLLERLRQRWTPDGSLAIVAELSVSRPQLGPGRASNETHQPLPVRATGDVAEQLTKLEGQYVFIEGLLRRRYYRRDGESRWGQVEIWAKSIEIMTESN